MNDPEIVVDALFRAMPRFWPRRARRGCSSDRSPDREEPAAASVERWTRHQGRRCRQALQHWPETPAAESASDALQALSKRGGAVRRTELREPRRIRRRNAPAFTGQTRRIRLHCDERRAAALVQKREVADVSRAWREQDGVARLRVGKGRLQIAPGLEPGSLPLRRWPASRTW